MVSGMPPFRSVNDYHTFQKIQKLDYSFPEGFPDLPRDLVQKLLVCFNSNAFFKHFLTFMQGTKSTLDVATFQCFWEHWENL